MHTHAAHGPTWREPAWIREIGFLSFRVRCTDVGRQLLKRITQAETIRVAAVAQRGCQTKPRRGRCDSKRRDRIWGDLEPCHVLPVRHEVLRDLLRRELVHSVEVVPKHRRKGPASRSVILDPERCHPGHETKHAAKGVRRWLAAILGFDGFAWASHRTGRPTRNRPITVTKYLLRYCRTTCTHAEYHVSTASTM